MIPKRNLVLRAQEFGRRAHDSLVETTITGIVRPKTVHIQEVADLVWASGGSDEEIAAAWLHDSIEDTPTRLEDIEEHFGKEVANIVRGLTDPDHFKNLPIPERKCKQAERIHTENESVRRVKLADQTSNARFVAIDPPDSMTIEECGQYMQGVKMIADECKGISPLLDTLFDQAYKEGVEHYFTHQK